MKLNAKKIKKILIYFYVKDLPVGEIALALMIPEKTVRNTLKKYYIPPASKFQIDAEGKFNRYVNWMINEYQRQNEKIKELEGIIEAYKEKDRQFQQIKEKLIITSQELEKEKQSNAKNTELVRKQDQQQKDMKEEHRKEILVALQTGFRKVTEDHNKKEAKLQENIDSLTKEMERQKKHREFMNSTTFQTDSNDTSFRFDWRPIALVGTLTAGMIFLPVVLNYLKKTAISNPLQNPIMDKESIPLMITKPKPPTPLKTTISNHLDQTTTPNPPLKPIMDSVSIPLTTIKSTTSLSPQISLGSLYLFQSPAIP